jgi:SsrA-binding protein
MAAEVKYIIDINNRKAAFQFHFLSELEAGMVLLGSEMKSIRQGQVNLRDAFCYFENDELFVKSLYIKEYEQANQFNHEARRPRKLLLRRTELKKLHKKIKEKGFTIVPFRLYINAKGRAKLMIALAQGKKSYDKRDSIKAKDNKRDMDRMKKIQL